MMVKFKDAPLGSVFSIGHRNYTILETHGDGLIASVECVGPLRQSMCCFVDDNEGVTLDTEIEITTFSSVIARIEALEAALTEAHRVILHELDSGRTPFMLKAENGGKGLGYFEDVLSGVNHS